MDPARDELPALGKDPAEVGRAAEALEGREDVLPTGPPALNQSLRGTLWTTATLGLLCARPRRSESIVGLAGIGGLALA